MKVYIPYVKCLAVMDERKAAWNTSRPDFKPGDLPFEEVERMDLSLNSMRVYTLEIRSSVLFRDLIFSLRPMQAWAQSTRSAPLNRNTLRLSSEFCFNFKDDENIDKMMALHEQGESRDKIRDLLPLSISTVYTMTIDHRVLMGFLLSLKELNEELFDLYGHEILKAIDGFDALDKTTVRPIHPFLKIRPEERINGTMSAGSMIFGHYKMKCALAAQFLRQHYSKIKIGYWDIVHRYFDVHMLQSDQIDVAYYIDTQSYDRLMQLRSHWALDFSMDMWGTMLNDYTKDMTAEDFWNFIPQGGGRRDPYWADVYNRVLRKDPGVPCPIMTECYDMILKREDEIGQNPILDKYKQLFDEGFIKDNPSNEYRKLYYSTGE